MISRLSGPEARRRRRDLAVESHQRGAGFVEADAAKPAAFARPHLGEAADVGQNDMAEFWIAAGRLPVGHQDERRLIAGDLDGAERDAVGHDVMAPRMGDRRAREAIGHAVGRPASG